MQTSKRESSLTSATVSFVVGSLVVKGWSKFWLKVRVVCAAIETEFEARNSKRKQKAKSIRGVTPCARSSASGKHPPQGGS
jgi:hypothetical protein